jgi:hypothetical protein
MFSGFEFLFSFEICLNSKFVQFWFFVQIRIFVQFSKFGQIQNFFKLEIVHI